MCKTALIDNDFVQNIAGIKHGINRDDFIRDVFKDAGVAVKMHELVHKYEFQNINGAGSLFYSGLFSILKLETLFGDNPEKEKYYRILVPELYKKLTGENISEIGIKDVIKDWKSNNSLGELHSLAACFIGDYAIFLSDDRGSKNIAALIEKDYRKSIVVYSREEFVNKLSTAAIKRKDRRIFAHKK